MFVIQDSETEEFYRRQCGPKGWYSSDLESAKVYLDKSRAELTIRIGGHHVEYPGNRKLVVRRAFIALCEQ